MRKLIVLLLGLAFVVMVILPNDIGTRALPAVNAKHVVIKIGSHLDKPTSDGLAVTVNLVELECLALAIDGIALVRIAPGAPLPRAYSGPLLI